MLNQSTPSISLREIEPGILLITLDMPGSGANILTQELFAELDQTMAELSERNDIDGAILYSAKKSIFIAGADLKLINSSLDWPDEEIIRFCERGRAVMARFSRCPFITVAAIHGACVGGGLELPLWCDFRIASDDRRTVLGLPEVKLGLVPGWAGTVRLPRIANLEVACDLITSGRLVSAAEAKTMAFVDEVCDATELIPKATELIRRVQVSQSFIGDRTRIMEPVSDLSGLQEKNDRYGLKIINHREIYPYAPTVALEHLLRSALMPQKAAWKSESLAMAQVWGSPASRGLLNHFFLVDRNKKQPGLVDISLTPKAIRKIGIVGAGLMGRSIAQHGLKLGVSVAIHDATPELARNVANELTQPGAAATIRAIDNYAEFADADLVIESVVETIPVKKEVLKKIDAATPTGTLIASNTSAIPIGKLAEAIDGRQTFCGIHFCHPEMMSLVEVICGPDTSEQTVADAVGFVRSLKKMAVAMNDGAGFVVNRLLAAMLDQSLRISAQGVTIEEIDLAMREFGFLGGPFEIIDVIGADTCMYAGRTMWESGLRCVSLSPVLPRMMKLGRLGRKTGLGFYRYPDPRGERVSDEALPGLLASYRTKQPMKNKLRLEQISEQILSVMVLEASHILEEEIVGDFRDLDLCVIHGFSFPQHRGGILFWADQVGLKTVNQTLYKLAETDPHLEPSELLKSMRFGKKTFYPAGNQISN